MQKKIQCPRCFGEDVTAIADSHYVCNNLDCFDDNKNRTQFLLVEDTNVKFPDNQVFVSRSKSEFYRKPYLKLESVGSESDTK